jgi:tetratricopeptide (TPR) repeat protein
LRKKSLHLFILSISYFFMLNPVQAEEISQQELNELLAQGTEMFNKAGELALTDPAQAEDLYYKAAIYWQRIVNQAGVKNGKLFYNIGNAYFKAGDIGRSILYYKKAQKYIPNDNNLIHNLAYVRSTRMDKIVEKQENQIFRILFFWYFALNRELRFFIFLISFISIWIFLSIKLFFKKSLFNIGLIISLVISFSFAGTLIADATIETSKELGVIITDEVIARKGDGFTYQPSFREALHAGTEFALIESRREWYNIELADGKTCWVQSRDVELVDY